MKKPKILKEIEIKEMVSIKWELLIIFSNLFQIIGSSVSFMNQKNMNYSINFIIALGAFLCYIGTGKYMDYAPNHALFFRSLSNLWPIFIPFFLATITIFIAFTLVGQCLFWNSERFTSLSDIIKTLFMLFTGDFYDTASDLIKKDLFFGFLYSFSYFIIFYIVVLDVFNSIVQSAFIKAKFEARSNWIYNSLLKESHEETNENLKDLPNIEKMSQRQIIQLMQKRIKVMNAGLNKCMDLVQDVNNNKIDIETKTSLKKLIYRKIEEIDKKFECIKSAWKNS